VDIIYLYPLMASYTFISTNDSKRDLQLCLGAIKHREYTHDLPMHELIRGLRMTTGSFEFTSLA